MDDDNPPIDRRTLLQRTLLGTAIAATGARSAPRCETIEWHREVDVVVVGSGTGLVAALVAAEAGKEVLIVEKSAAPGGNTFAYIAGRQLVLNRDVDAA
jgi:ribulose 1,5-bisphosphate synthetase/thiazole synthase